MFFFFPGFAAEFQNITDHESLCTVFSRLNAPGVYLKLALRDPAFI